MGKFNFGARSMKEIETMVPDLKVIFLEAIKHSDVDFGVSQGGRTVAQQLEYFLAGNSKIDPRKYKPATLVDVAKHVTNELSPLSRAGDIFISVPGKPAMAYDIKSLCYVAGLMTSTANRLFDEGKIKSRLRWGGNWDMDGEIYTDQTFQDLPHFEIHQ